jgi:Flp pilus assembly protein CpaB
MKPARVIVLVIAVLAGGIAALLAGRSNAPPPTPAPVVQIETTDLRIVGTAIGLGDTLASRDLPWQTWTAAAADLSFIRKSDRPDAVNQLAGSLAFEIGPRQTGMLAVSRRQGTISLALRSLVDFDRKDKPEPLDDGVRAAASTSFGSE